MANSRGRPKKQKLVLNDTQAQELKRLAQQSRTSRKNRPKPIRDQPHLEGLRTAAPSQPDLSALQRSLSGGESARHRGVIYEPARPCVGSLCGREKSNSGLKSHPAHLADATGTGGV